MVIFFLSVRPFFAWVFFDCWLCVWLLFLFYFFSFWLCVWDTRVACANGNGRAGGAVTAMGVMADLIKVVQRIS